MKLLLLAGTAEARALAARLAALGRVEVVAALAGETRAPEAYPVPLRMGGFGGDEAFGKYLENNGLQAVLDVTHPFARIMPWRARVVSERLGLPCLKLLRPGWTPAAGERWRFAPDAAAVAEMVPDGARVLLATGRKSLAGFAALAAGRHLVVRVVDPPEGPFPFPQGEWVVGRPPFSLSDEIALMRAHRIEALVAKNAGGPARAKLDAARVLGLPVVLIDRPVPPPGPRVETVEAALDWVERLL